MGDQSAKSGIFMATASADGWRKMGHIVQISMIECDIDVSANIEAALE